MARAYLCSGCGQIMGRMLGVCPVCRCKNLVFYDSDRSSALTGRQGKIRGHKKQSTPGQANMIVVAGLSVFMGAGYFFTHYWDEIVSHPAISRTVAVLIPHSGRTSASSSKNSQQFKETVAAIGRPTH